MKPIRAWMVIMSNGIPLMTDDDHQLVVCSQRKRAVWKSVGGDRIERVKIVSDPPRKGKGNKA